MATIWKFEVPGAFTVDPILRGAAQINDIFNIEMPSGAKVLSAGEQEGRLVIWAYIPNEKSESFGMRVQTVGTGWEIQEPEAQWHFIGTVQRENSSLVCHVFCEYFVRIRKEDQ